ncbi:integral membrane sensor signal transduction histidine kinase [Brucella melitensis]|nr:integral membrane sensor signal transduction histidine kinase [Brucella melitensis]
MMSRFSALMRTTAARLSALYLLLFAVGAVALVFYMTKPFGFHSGRADPTGAGEEVASIGKSYARGGIPQLVRTIDYRSRQPGAYLYLVADPTGRILAGMWKALNRACSTRTVLSNVPLPIAVTANRRRRWSIAPLPCDCPAEWNAAARRAGSGRT